MTRTKATYRPPLRVPVGWLLQPDVGGRIAVPAFDEDEATMAVAAAAALMDASHVPPVKILQLNVISHTGPNAAPIVAAAIAIPAEHARENPLLPETPNVLTLTIQVEAPRPGRPVPVEARSGALAVASFSGPGAPEGADVDLEPNSEMATREAFDKMARWESEAPQRMTMGAYVPRTTWERNAPARYRLEASVCKERHVEFPPRPRCASCGEPTTVQRLARGGTLESFTVVAKGAGPSEFEPLQDVVGEYGVGVADFGGARVPGIMTETPLQALRIGATVEPVFRRLYAQDGQWRYGVKFRRAVNVS